MRASAVLRATLVLLLLLVPAASAQLPPPLPVIAGTGEEITDDDSRGDGGPATEGRFHWVDGLDSTPGGSILVADGEDKRIRRITPSGNIVTNRSEGLDDPIAVVSIGVLPADPFERHDFVASDVGDDTVERWQLISNLTWQESVIMEDVDATDVERAIDGYWVADPGAGTVWYVRFIPFPTNAWEQSPALEGLDELEGIGPLPGGGFLVATSGAGDCRIRRHTENGTVVVAGASGLCAGRERTGHGDGGPATEAWLRFPTDVEATPDGGFVFIERERVRHVAPDGTLSTVFYPGPPGSIPSPDFPFPEPSALEVTPDGDVLIGLNRQVLRFDTNYAPPATPTPGGTNPLPPPPPGPDTTKPGLALGGKNTQKAGKTVSVVVSATTEDLFASASGTVSVPAVSQGSVAVASKTYKLKAIANRFVANGTKATLKLKVSKAALKAIKRALLAKKKVKASIKLTARDAAGNLTTAKRTVKLKR